MSTGWKQAGQKRWLWAAVSNHAVYFLVQVGQQGQALRGLLGAAFQGVIGSDRWGAYQAIPWPSRQNLLRA